MIEMMKTAMSGFTNYISNNHMLVLALAAMVWVLALRGKKSGIRVALLTLGMCLVLWIPVTSVILMKLQTSFYGYESLWGSFVAVPAMIALGGVLFLQWEEKKTAGPNEESADMEKLGRQKKTENAEGAETLEETAYAEKARHLRKTENVKESLLQRLAQKRIKLWNGKEDVKLALGVALVFLAIALLGNMGRIQVVDAYENNTSPELRQLLSSIVMEQAKGGNIGRDKLWAPAEIIMKAREMNGDITLLYGRDLWESEAAACSYDNYGSDYVDLYEFMESLWEVDPLDIIEDGEIRETAMNDRGITDGMVVANAKMLGSGLWVMPRCAENRLNYALEVLEKEYCYKVDVVSTTTNYIIYKIEE